jgi:DNA-binding response OmpR family regulator
MLIDLSFSGTEEDGLALLRELTELTPQLPVIVFAGRDTLADRLAVSRLGAKQFLHKPATTEEIFRAISRVLAKTQSLQAKVLIVDDDAAVLAHLSALLKPWGLEVITLTEPVARFIYARNGWVCCVRDPRVRSDYPIDSPDSADSESFAQRSG